MTTFPFSPNPVGPAVRDNNKLTELEK
jgi:hypothetical protein